MEEDILAQIYWHSICSCFEDGQDFEKWLLERLPPSTEVYGVFWTSDVNISFLVTRVHAIIATRLAVSENDLVRDIERLCKIKHRGCVIHSAEAQRAEPGDLGWIVKAIEGKPASGNPRMFGQKFGALIQHFDSLTLSVKP